MNKEKTHWFRKAIRLPDGWLFVLVGFLFTAYFLVGNYRLAKKAQEQPNLILSFKKQEVPGSVLEPTQWTKTICRKSFDHSKFHFNTREINKITITNDSSVEAKQVLVKLIIKPDKPFVFSVVSVGEKYPRYDWRIVDPDEDIFRSVAIKIDYIRGDRDDCNVYFVYAYPKSLSKKKGTVEENALSVIVTWEGYKTSLRKKFDLEYHL